LPRAAEALGGPILTLVNNASIFEYDRIETATRESWDRHVESNLRAPFVLTQAMAAQIPDPLIDAGGEPLAQGLVINMIDQRVRKLTPEFMSYTIAKMGLWAFTQTAAQGLAPRVRVNAIGPGPTLQGRRQSEDHFARQRAATVLGGARTRAISVRAGLFPRCERRDRAADLRRWRTAPGMGNARCSGRRGLMRRKLLARRQRRLHLLHKKFNVFSILEP
jgi:NAD(P)-dependent dehydrogenase (short-subunit alcohol dehydrogenase family)